MFFVALLTFREDATIKEKRIFIETYVVTNYRCNLCLLIDYIALPGVVRKELLLRTEKDHINHLQCSNLIIRNYAARIDHKRRLSFICYIASKL